MMMKAIHKLSVSNNEKKLKENTRSNIWESNRVYKA